MPKIETLSIRPGKAVIKSAASEASQADLGDVILNDQKISKTYWKTSKNLLGALLYRDI